MQKEHDTLAVGLEVCVASLSDACVAARAGAVRVELNSALELGGLTPSIGLVSEVVRALGPMRCGVVALIRPRPGHFAYEPGELAVMRRDIAQAIEAGVDGVALGVLGSDGQIDARACHALIEPVLRAGRQAVFHRAFDLTPDPMAALEVLIDLGFTRVLTSGGAATAMQGAGVIRALIASAAGRIEVLPGSGVRADNVVELVRATGCRQVHASLRCIAPDVTGSRQPSIQFNSPAAPEGRYHATDSAKVAEMMRALRGLNDSV